MQASVQAQLGGEGLQPWQDSHSLPLHQLHVVLGACIVFVRAQGSPEVGPQLPVAGQHGCYDLPMNRWM